MVLPFKIPEQLPVFFSNQVYSERYLGDICKPHVPDHLDKLSVIGDIMEFTRYCGVTDRCNLCPRSDQLPGLLNG